MSKCESSNCSNSSKSFGEGNVNARAEIYKSSETNRNGRNYKDCTWRKDVNNMGKTNENNNSNAGNNKDRAFNSFEEFLMASSLAPLHFIMNNKESNKNSAIKGKCPLFDENREKCKNCTTFNNGEKDEVPDFLKFIMELNNEEAEKEIDEDEEEKDQNESSDDLNLFKDGKKIPLGEVLAHIANVVDSIQTDVGNISAMVEDSQGGLIQGEPILMEGIHCDRSCLNIDKKLKKINNRIKELDAKLDAVVELLPHTIANVLIQKLKEADEQAVAEKNAKKESKSK